MKRVASVLGFLLGMLCLYLFLKTASSHWNAFLTLDPSGPMLVYLALAITFYLLTYLLSSRSWQLAMRLAGSWIPYRSSIQIVLLSQIGKYIPGNIAQHLGRIVLARRQGIDTSRVVASIALEAILLVLAAALSTLAALNLLTTALSIHGPSIRHNMEIAAAIALVTVLLSLLFPAIRNRLLPLAAKCAFLFSRQSIFLSARIIATHIASFVIGATALWLAVCASGQEQFPALSLLGVYSIAWLIGFIVPGAPAGLGIREALLVLGLGSLYGLETASTATILFRITTVLGDGVAFLLGLLLRNRWRPASS
ncbi:lysylphosphatidylglycerol synthase domain-containing protein [Pseudoxanthomonas sp. 22568]|uniref:lysylphosphatidylglycerol synthase domain-containing protein n=1 Tax=Pseudoxanthomonas sp. 22568 TaxID=3453945 RepID=UPI003F84E9A8